MLYWRGPRARFPGILFFESPLPRLRSTVSKATTWLDQTRAHVRIVPLADPPGDTGQTTRLFDDRG